MKRLSGFIILVLIGLPNINAHSGEFVSTGDLVGIYKPITQDIGEETPYIEVLRSADGKNFEVIARDWTTKKAQFLTTTADGKFSVEKFVNGNEVPVTLSNMSVETPAGFISVQTQAYKSSAGQTVVGSNFISVIGLKTNTQTRLKVHWKAIRLSAKSIAEGLHSESNRVVTFEKITNI